MGDHRFAWLLTGVIVVCSSLPTATQFPPAFDITMRIKDDVMALNLTLMDGPPQNDLTIVSSGGNFTVWENTDSQDYGVYWDETHGASFVLRTTETTESNKTEVRGIFDYADQGYEMAPMSGSHSPLPGDILASIEGVTHMATAASQPSVYPEDMPIKPNVSAMTGNKEDALRISPDASASYYRGYGVETLLFVDYSIYRKWLRQSGSHAQAISDIRFYFNHIINGMDLRYRSMQQTDFGIYVRLKALFIATSAADSPWTEGRLREGGEFTEAYDCLDFFEEWLSKNKDRLPEHDQATLFTGNKLFSRRSDGSRREISGLADVEGICTSFGASVNRDFGQYASVQTGAHEMGHNLGAKHDGTGNGCTGRDQYIMASSPGNLDERNFRNTFRFSHCSIRAFRDHLNFLNYNKTNCLMNGARSVDPRELEWVLRTLPGARFTPDQQCRTLLKDESSYYCGGAAGDEDRICRKMRCWEPRSRKCITRVEQRAFDGTQCGDRKWCLKGRCTPDSRAPTATTTCLYGDYRGHVLNDQGPTCETIRTREQFRCYDKEYRDECCATCSQIRERSPAECPYGDLQPNYCRGISRSSCYEASTRTSCCATCAQSHWYKPANKGCEYGDKARRCATLTLGQCYRDETTCCESCPRRALSNPECRYGDAVSWCNILTSQQCYTKYNRDQCCQRCDRLRLSGAPSGCEWGDKWTDCRESDCANRASECCRTCANNVAPGCKDMWPSWCQSLRHDACYDSYTMSKCCATCKQRETLVTGCEYGDRAGWCGGYIKSQSDCVRYGRDCCKTCGNIKDPRDVCEDKAEWCGRLHPGECYSASTSATCCRRCAALRNPSKPGCEYGDKVTWCATKYCGQHRANCCQTCSSI